MNSTAVDYFHFSYHSKAQLCVLEKLTESRTSPFRLKNLQIYLSWWNWTCFCSCLPQKGIRQPSTANYSVGWNARAPRRWQSITKTDAEDEAHKGKSSMLKAFLPSEGKTHDVSSSLDLLINSQHRHTGTLFAALPGTDNMFSCQELQVSTVEGHLQISPLYLPSVFSALIPRPLLKPTLLGGPEPWLYYKRPRPHGSACLPLPLVHLIQWTSSFLAVAWGQLPGHPFSLPSFLC